MLGRGLAAVVDVVNPSLVIVGGGVARSGDVLLAAIRESLYQAAFPSATTELRVASSLLSDTAGLVGAAHMVVDELLSVRRLPLWLDAGSPAGLAARIHRPETP
ncbi:hypothetical protein STENM327S_07045 [Streptomyces tendae]